MSLYLSPQFKYMIFIYLFVLILHLLRAYYVEEYKWIHHERSKIIYLNCGERSCRAVIWMSLMKICVGQRGQNDTFQPIVHTVKYKKQSVKQYFFGTNSLLTCLPNVFVPFTHTNLSLPKRVCQPKLPCGGRLKILKIVICDWYLQKPFNPSQRYDKQLF